MSSYHSEAVASALDQLVDEKADDSRIDDLEVDFNDTCSTLETRIDDLESEITLMKEDFNQSPPVSNLAASLQIAEGKIMLIEQKLHEIARVLTGERS